MSSSPLEAMVNHEGRLDVLCCLIDGEPLAVSQLSARTGRPPTAVGHYVELLGSFRLVERTESPDGGESLYAATLQGQPDWVRRAIDRHRRPS